MSQALPPYKSYLKLCLPTCVSDSYDLFLFEVGPQGLDNLTFLRMTIFCYKLFLIFITPGPEAHVDLRCNKASDLRVRSRF